MNQLEVCGKSNLVDTVVRVCGKKNISLGTVEKQGDSAGSVGEDVLAGNM